MCQRCNFRDPDLEKGENSAGPPPLEMTKLQKCCGKELALFLLAVEVGESYNTVQVGLGIP